MGNFWAYVKIAVAALLPVLAAAALYLANKKTAFGKLNDKVKQVIYGVIFGLIAVFGTEYGVPLNGAQINSRDAAVLIGGLIFGAPAGIIAGLIGGIERWIAVAWGVGAYSRVACSLATAIAGFYAAGLRKYMFDDKKPGFLFSLAIGVVMEIFHLTLLFLTHMDAPEQALDITSKCLIPMVTANGISVMLASLSISLLSGEKIKLFTRGTVHISETVQTRLLATVFLAFATTSIFIFSLQGGIADTQCDNQLALALNDVSADISDASDSNLLSLTYRISCSLGTELTTLAKRFQVEEINVVNKDGIIEKSTNPDFVGFDFHSGEQSAVFLVLLGDEVTQMAQEYGPITYDPSILRKYAGIKIKDGFVQVGYNSEQFLKDMNDQVLGITKNRHVGETGYILVLDESSNIVSAPERIQESLTETSIPTESIPAPGETFRAVIAGEPCFCQYGTAESFTIVSVLPEEEAYEMRKIVVGVNACMEILVFAVLFAMVYMLIKRVIVNQIKCFNVSLAKIAGGDLDVVVDVRTNTEFASLSDDINSTVDTLKHYIAEASAKIDKELEFAKSIQSSALPNVFPAFPKRKDFDIHATMDTAKEVGGDFYDFYMTNSDTLHFLIADVSGKGIPAAMFMMRAKTELKTLTESEVPLSEVFTHGNAALCEGNDAGMFVTAWQGSINLTTGLVKFANAGHNPPLVRHVGGRFEYLKSRVGFVLAGMEGVRYRTQELQLQPGDIIFLYTDGVTEATDAHNELYGEERLQNAINSREFESMEALCKFIKTDVDAFVGEAPQFDDITMVALKFIGTPPAPEMHFDAATLNDIPVVTEFVEAELEKLECPMKFVIQFSVAIDEIFSNIVHYGYKEGTGPVTVTVIEKDDPHTVSLRFVDEGIPYNPLKKEDPDVTLSAEERKIGGLGIYMVKKTMDEMRYEYENDQNILTITKKI